MDLLELLKKRYSVRKFDDRKVEKEKLDLILEAGRVAPTAVNFQPQRILVIEAQEALERAKSNETLFNKQVAAIRREYKALEDENIKQAQYEQEEQAKERYHQFANQIVSYIDDFNEFSGYDLNLTDEDKDDLYDFITGQDGAGNNYFAKALSDPKILVQTAWFALNGKQMVDDITSYFQNEIKQVRKDSYQKGLEDARKGGNSVVYANKEKKSRVYDDLDNF